MKYIAHCIPVLGGYELEVLEVDESDIFDTYREAWKSKHC